MWANEEYIQKNKQFRVNGACPSAEPLRLEFILSDYCNLNCKGCTHYSRWRHASLNQSNNSNALPRTSAPQSAKGLGSVYLIGGETLLYPHLPEAMDILRKHFPDTRILLFTNGILLPKMAPEFWESARRNKVVMAVTRYPVAFDYDAAEALCRTEGVGCEIFGDRGGDGAFFRFSLDPQKRQNGRLSHFKCFNRGCISVVGDKVYPCSISACVGHLNGACGTKFEHRPGDWLDVADISDIRQIKQLRDKPVPFCGYCRPNPTVTDYGPSRRHKSEWVD